MAAGFNGARLHEKVFEPRFLYHCDRLGYIVWGEFPNWGFDCHNPHAVEYYSVQWTEAVNRDFNHPSIVGWCPFNETWGYYEQTSGTKVLSTVYHITKAIDSTRPCIDTSGNFHVVTDIYDIHATTIRTPKHSKKDTQNSQEPVNSPTPRDARSMPKNTNTKKAVCRYS